MVLRFSRSRKRSERGGVLVTEEALQAAQASCDADRDRRERKNAAPRVRRLQEEADFVRDFAAAVRAGLSGCPAEESESIARHACEVGSPRVGRSRIGKALDPKAVALAVRAHVRHQHTCYDEVLAATHDRHGACETVAERVELILGRWGGDPA